VPRSGNALSGWRPGDRRVCGFGQPDGPFRDEMAESAREPRRSRRSARPNNDWGSKPSKGLRPFLSVRAIGERVGAHIGQTRCVIQLAMDQQSAIGGDHAVPKTEASGAVKSSLRARLSTSPAGSALAVALDQIR
jgi:hypothetical protein